MNLTQDEWGSTNANIEWGKFLPQQANSHLPLENDLFRSGGPHAFSYW
jgi:hypothetical protein